MAIQETKKRIHFTTFEITKGRAVDTEPAPTVSIADGTFRFNTQLIKELNLANKFVRFAYDANKNVIGFQVKDEMNLEVLGKWKMVNPNKTTGMWTVSIRKMMVAVFGEEKAAKKYLRLPVKKYVDTGALTKGEVFYYVELSDVEEGTTE